MKYKKILIGIVAVLLVIILGVGGYGIYLSSKINRVEIDRDEVKNVATNPVEVKDNIVTIAIFGTDEKNEEGLGFSDSIMIATINPDTKKLNLASIQRDTYVELPDGSKNNINRIGLPSDIIKALNYNFDLQIDKFVQIGLNDLPKVIDTIGGIELELTKSEVDYINKGYLALDKKNGTNSPKLVGEGKLHLTGTQATTHSRNRSTSGSDFKRTERQRAVIDAIFLKLNTISLIDANSLVNKILPMVHTNITNGEIFDLINLVLSMRVSNINKERFPLNNQYTTEITDMFHVIFDKEKTKEALHSFLYE